MIAAAERLPAALDDAQPPPLAAIDRRELVEMDHAVRDRMDGAVARLGGEVVEHQHGRLVLREVMFQREHLTPIAQRALRQQTNFRETVDHDAFWLESLDR